MAVELFPLPLTPFEFYYWCDDRPDYPTTYPLELMFSGPLRRDAFEAALGLCLARHPLLAANVDITVGKIPRWIPAQDRSLPLDWADSATPIDHAAGRYIDLTRNVGVRLWARIGPEQSRLVLQIHHACSDALGQLQFVSDLLVAYDSTVAGTDPSAKLPPLEPERLRLRGDFGLTKAGYRPNWRDAGRTAGYWVKRLLCRPSLVVAPRDITPQPTSDTADLGFVLHTLDKVDRDLLQARAARAGITINDLLLCDLLVTLRDWNRQHGGDRRRLVVNVPVSLRMRGDQLLPAANVLGFWFLDRKQSECDDAERLFAGVRDELAAVRKWRLPLYFVGGLGYACRFPSMIRSVLHSDRSFATVVLSNAGRLLGRLPLEHEERKWISGGVRLERITGAPPVRPGTRASLILGNYGRDTYLNLNWDPHELTEPAARALLAAYVRQLTKST